MEINNDVLRLAGPDQFFWAAGIEDTFITFPWPATGRTLDEYELTGHYERWREDLDLLPEIGIRVVRYGIPWHRIQPTRRSWDWSFADRALERLLELGIEPVVDLVHYGLPAWIEDAYLNPDFPEWMAEYAGRVAERFRGRLYYYTPLNEPRITAWYCGKLGWWPPGRRGWRGFLQVMNAVCRGVVKTVHRLAEVSPEIVPVHVDATDLYETLDPELKAEVHHRQEMVFLALDLISGRVNRAHELYEWVIAKGMTAAQLEWFETWKVGLPMIGINLYPMFTRKHLWRSSHGLRARMIYADGDLIDQLATKYWERYSAPLFISETASVGSVRRREAWLQECVGAVRRVRERGIPLLGFTWWPLFALVTWAYRQGRLPPDHYLAQMGLWDLRNTESGALERVPTNLVKKYCELVSQVTGRVGELRLEAVKD